jgi:SecD/SecF fusion protein
MVFYYSSAGWAANIALVANILIIIGVLAAAPTISLTLPGVAGIVLTVGMSVDANVLIYERIREELKLGKSLKIAIADGYKHAYTAILDANITTLITGVILWYFGTSVIESFAQTLIIGIFTSLFSAIFITRLIFDSLLGKEKNIKFSTEKNERLVFENYLQHYLFKEEVLCGFWFVNSCWSCFNFHEGI